MKLTSIVNELTTYLPEQDQINTSISNSTIGWQIEHILLTINQVIISCDQSLESKYQPKFSLWKTVVLTTKKIPRGKVKAPKIVRPEEFDKNSLEIHLNQTIENLKIIDHLKQNQYFNHPFFGHLNKSKMVKFLEIHSYHHLKIIREIIKKTN